MINTPEPIKVVIVDDSFFMREALNKILSTDEIRVVGIAKNGKEAIEKVMELKPDIVTLDIEMPIMNGLEALKEIMTLYPLPVLMISSLTTESADSTLEALSLGAIDFVTKKGAFRNLDNIREEILSKVINISRNSGIKNQFIRQRLLQKVSTHKKEETASIPHARIEKLIEKKESEQSNKISGKNRPSPDDIKVICIGISTGGPAALMEVIPNLPQEIPVPIVIAQHMPPYFTNSLANRLDSISKLHIVEAVDGDKILPGTVYIAPGGLQMTINKYGRINISKEPEGELFKPSVNILLGSIVDSFGKNAVGIMMTGMGNDGQKAFFRLHQAGGYIIVQDIDSCVVSGMPKSVIDLKIADEIHPLIHFPEMISSLFKLHPASNFQE